MPLPLLLKKQKQHYSVWIEAELFRPQFYFDNKCGLVDYMNAVFFRFFFSLMK